MRFRIDRIKVPSLTLIFLPLAGEFICVCTLSYYHVP